METAVVYTRSQSPQPSQSNFSGHFSNLTSRNGSLFDSFNASVDSNLTAVVFEPRHGLLHIIIASIVLGLIILCTIVGNVFVVAAIILEKNLQSVSNYLILSLAVADLMVATLVMPISALNELSKSWWLGTHLCDLWTCFDVLCCTASILHLVVIAIDRYWAVTNVDYIRVRTARRIGAMIAAVWIISVTISVPARFWIMDSVTRRRERKIVVIDGNCRINPNWVYTIFSTLGAFYLPMLFMIGIYIKIYKAARRRIRKKAFKQQKQQKQHFVSQTNDAKVKKMKKVKRMKKRARAAGADDADSRRGAQSSESDAAGEFGGQQQQTTSFTANHKSNGRQQLLMNQQTPQTPQTPQTQARHRDKLEQRRERKAARTLAIITGCFLVCWLPFFVRAIVCPFYSPLCTELIPALGHSFVQWLGYMNSLLNPIIYTIFSPDFRNAFSKILFGRYRRRGYR